jgi:hypothetical protein
VDTREKKQARSREKGYSIPARECAASVLYHGQYRRYWDLGRHTHVPASHHIVLADLPFFFQDTLERVRPDPLETFARRRLVRLLAPVPVLAAALLTTNST